MIRINLLPVRKKKARNTAIMHLAVITTLVVVATAAMFIWVGVLDGEAEKQERRISEHEQEVKRLEKIIGEVSELEAQTDNLKKQLDVIDKLERGKRGPVHVMDELSSYIPKRVWLKGFAESGERLTLNGVGLENSDIAEFLRALQKSKYFTNVKLGLTERSEEDGVKIYTFTITCKVNYSA